jgi:thiosulfate reductase cytochrome b subunit
MIADSTWVPNLAVPSRAATVAPRHSALVRLTHWLTALCFVALLVSGTEIVISHPRFYWGEVGNVMTPSLFELPIPASRASVPTGYGFVLPDQNGWSRSLHFQTAWVAVLIGLLYVLSGLSTGHFRVNLVPAGSDLKWPSLSRVLADHIRFKPPAEAEATSYNALQRLTYLGVIFLLFPLMIWTGLAMSPAVASAFPSIVTLLGGHQSARTIHFLGFAILVFFLLIHVVMVCRAGFRNRVQAMITGRTGTQGQHR